MANIIEQSNGVKTISINTPYEGVNASINALTQTVAGKAEQSDLDTTNAQLAENTQRLGNIKSILEYQNLMTTDGLGNQDWTAAIQKALDDIYSNQNLTIKFPNGVYRITGSLKVNDYYMINFQGEATSFYTNNSTQTKASTIVLDVADNNIGMFDNKASSSNSNASYASYVGGEIKDMGFMCYTGNFYGAPKNIFAKNVHFAYSGFVLERCLIAQFKYIFYNGSLGGGTMIRDCSIRGIGKAFCSNTIIGDAQIFNNYFNGFMNDDGTSITYPDFIDHDNTLTTFSLNQINDNWFEFFRYLFVAPAYNTFSGNLFDYVGRVFDQCAYGNAVTGNVYSHCTQADINSNISARSRTNGMTFTNGYVNNVVYGSANSFVGNAIRYDLSDANATLFMKIFGYNQTGVINGITMAGNTAQSISVKWLFQNANSYSGPMTNMTNMNLYDVERAFTSSDFTQNASLIKGLRIKTLDKPLLITGGFTKYGLEITNPVIFYNSENVPYNFINTNLVPDFNNSAWIIGSHVQVNTKTVNKMQVQSSSTGNVEIYTDLTLNQGVIYRLGCKNSLNGVATQIALRFYNSSGTQTRVDYIQKTTSADNETYFMLASGEVKVRIDYTYNSTTVGDAGTYIRPILTAYTDTPSYNVMGGVDAEGSQTKYIKVINDGVETIQEFFLSKVS